MKNVKAEDRLKTFYKNNILYIRGFKNYFYRVNNAIYIAPVFYNFYDLYKNNVRVVPGKNLDKINCSHKKYAKIIWDIHNE